MIAFCLNSFASYLNLRAIQVDVVLKVNVEKLDVRVQEVLMVPLVFLDRQVFKVLLVIVD